MDNGQECESGEFWKCRNERMAVIAVLMEKNVFKGKMYLNFLWYL